MMPAPEFILWIFLGAGVFVGLVWFCMDEEDVP